MQDLDILDNRRRPKGLAGTVIIANKVYAQRSVLIVCRLDELKPYYLSPPNRSYSWLFPSDGHGCHWPLVVGFTHAL
jgi:hypothetical protein